MDKLFDVIGVENIATQINDPIVDKLITRFDNIKRLMKTYRSKSSKHAFGKKEIKEEIEALDNDISDRFGLPYKHIYGSDGGYAVITVNQGVNNAIAPDREAILGTVEKQIAMCKTTGECGVVKDKKQVDGFNNSNMLTIMSDLINTTKTINKHLKTKDIKIDFNKAKIDNFPKDTIIYVIGDLYSLLIETNITSRELAAILMHEIGHSFTHIAYSYRQLENTTVLLETFTNNLKTEKNLRDNLVHSVKKSLNVDLKGNEAQVLTQLTTVMVENINGSNVYSSVDSEHLADQFAVRFGLGGDLATGLNKVIISFSSNSVFVSTLTTIFSIFIQALLFSFSLMLAISITVFSIILFGIISMLTTFIVGIDSNRNTYDITETRFKRMKLDLIRQIRESGLDKKYIKEVLKNIETIDTILVDYIDTKSLIGSIGDIMPWNIDKFINTRVQKELEDLSENELHVSKEKLKLILGDE